MELLSMPFRAFWTAFMTTFHVVKYFPTSLASLVSPPCLLRIVDWSSCMPVFISNKASLAMLQTSNSWSNHFLWWSWMNACWVRGNRSNLSTQSCKSWRSLSLWHIDDDEVASEVFSLHKYSTICKWVWLRGKAFRASMVGGYVFFLRFENV